MLRAAAIVLGLAALAGAAVGLGIVPLDESPPTKYRLVFDQAFGIVEGADFKVAGVRVGQVERMELGEDYPFKAIVTVVADKPGLRTFRRDATCEIRPQSLIGEYFVNCEPGQARARIPAGGTIPVSRTRPTIPPDIVANTLRRPYRARLAIILQTLGAGLAGRGEDLAAALRRAHPGLRETTETLRILGRQERILERFIIDSDRVIGELARRKRDVVRFVEEAGETAEITAGRRRELARTFDRLPGFLAELRPTMSRLGAVADAQIPVLRNLDRAAPDLRETFEELRPFARAAEPALVSLGSVARTGREAIDESEEEVDELRQLARSAPALGKPLRQLLQTLDDRRRSIEPDPRAKETAPPAPDKTAYRPGQGFTGMEALLNYFFWQTLAINGFDKVSHVLRFTAVIDPVCSPYAVKIPPEKRRCVSWLGPDQPGITTPDPTEGGRPSAARKRPEPAIQARPEKQAARGGQVLDYLLGP